MSDKQEHYQINCVKCGKLIDVVSPRIGEKVALVKANSSGEELTDIGCSCGEQMSVGWYFEHPEDEEDETYDPVPCYRCGEASYDEPIDGTVICGSCADTLVPGKKFRERINVSDPCFNCHDPSKKIEGNVNDKHYCGECLRELGFRVWARGPLVRLGPDPWEPVRKEIRVLKERAETLRIQLERAPFFRFYELTNGDPKAYARTKGPELRIRRLEIEREAEKLANDPVFLRFLRQYRPRLFNLAVFEALALEAALHSSESAES